MRILTARPSDVPAVQALLQSSPGVWQSAWRNDAVRRAVAAADGLAYIADEDGLLIGFACAHDVGFRAYLSELVVAESHQRQGVGPALLAAVERGLAERGCTLVVADVFPPAVPFYRRLHWREPRATLLCRDIGVDNAP
jgi:predicted N-acetyltransferase YhbS